MYVGRVVHKFHPKKGGDPFNSYYLSLNQSRLGKKVVVFTWGKEKRSVLYVINENFKFFRLKGLNLAFKPFFSEYPIVPCLGKMIGKEKPDILHAHSHLFLTTYSAVKTAKNLGIPSVVTIHGVLAKRDLLTNFLQYSYLYTLALQIFKKSTISICLTRSDAEQIASFGCPPERIRIVPNPVDTELFKPRSEIEEENLIVWVGRFVPEKGLKYLIEAARIVANFNKKAKFLLVGWGPLRSSLNNLIRILNLDDIVSIIGPIEHEKIAKIIARGSIFAFPSLKEGMPKGILEAMSMGKAIVASNIFGLSEIIENNFNGLLVQPRNAKTLASKIITLLDDKALRNRLGRNARETVLKRFTWKSILNQLDEVYEEAIENI